MKVRRGIIGITQNNTIFSKALLRSDISEDLLEHEEIGKKLYTDFIVQRLRR